MVFGPNPPIDPQQADWLRRLQMLEARKRQTPQQEQPPAPPDTFWEDILGEVGAGVAGFGAGVLTASPKTGLSVYQGLKEPLKEGAREVSGAAEDLEKAAAARGVDYKGERRKELLAGGIKSGFDLWGGGVAGKQSGLIDKIRHATEGAKGPAPDLLQDDALSIPSFESPIFYMPTTEAPDPSQWTEGGEYIPTPQEDLEGFERQVSETESALQEAAGALIGPTQAQIEGMVRRERILSGEFGPEAARHLSVEEDASEDPFVRQAAQRQLMESLGDGPKALSQQLSPGDRGALRTERMFERLIPEIRRGDLGLKRMRLYQTWKTPGLDPEMQEDARAELMEWVRKQDILYNR